MAPPRGMLARMKPLDLNLLVTLDVLIQEGSVVGAARRLNLSTPAMSLASTLPRGMRTAWWCSSSTSSAISLSFLL